MPRHYFSTGLLTASVPVAAAISARAVGEVDNNSTVFPVIAESVDNISDADPATQLTLNIADNANYQFLVLDLGSQQTVSRVVLQNVTTTGAASAVSCWVSNANSTSNAKPPVGGLLASGQAAGSVVAFSGVARTGRYVYILPDSITGAGTLKIGEAGVWTNQTLTFAELQSITTDVTFQSKPLRGPTNVSQFPVDCAYFDGAVSAKAEWADIKASTVQAVVAAAIDQATAGGYLLNGAVTLPPFDATFTGTSTDNKTMEFRLPRCYAPGLALPFKRDDWAMGSVEFSAYLADGTDGASPVAIWKVQQ